MFAGTLRNASREPEERNKEVRLAAGEASSVHNSSTALSEQPTPLENRSGQSDGRDALNDRDWTRSDASKIDVRTVISGGSHHPAASSFEKTQTQAQAQAQEISFCRTRRLAGDEDDTDSTRTTSSHASRSSFGNALEQDHARPVGVGARPWGVIPQDLGSAAPGSDAGGVPRGGDGRLQLGSAAEKISGETQREALSGSPPSSTGLTAGFSQAKLTLPNREGTANVSRELQRAGSFGTLASLPPPTWLEDFAHSGHGAGGVSAGTISPRKVDAPAATGGGGGSGVSGGESLDHQRKAQACAGDDSKAWRLTNTGGHRWPPTRSGNAWPAVEPDAPVGVLQCGGLWGWRPSEDRPGSGGVKAKPVSSSCSGTSVARAPGADSVAEGQSINGETPASTPAVSARAGVVNGSLKREGLQQQQQQQQRHQRPLRLNAFVSSLPGIPPPAKRARRDGQGTRASRSCASPKEPTSCGSSVGGQTDGGSTSQAVTTAHPISRPGPAARGEQSACGRSGLTLGAIFGTNNSTFIKNLCAKRATRSRAPYRCGKCGQIKSNHICPFKNDLGRVYDAGVIGSRACVPPPTQRAKEAEHASAVLPHPVSNQFAAPGDVGSGLQARAWQGACSGLDTAALRRGGNRQAGGAPPGESAGMHARTTGRAASPHVRCHELDAEGSVRATESSSRTFGSDGNVAGDTGAPATVAAAAAAESGMSMSLPGGYDNNAASIRWPNPGGCAPLRAPTDAFGEHGAMSAAAPPTSRLFQRGTELTNGAYDASMGVINHASFAISPHFSPPPVLPVAELTPSQDVQRWRQEMGVRVSPPTTPTTTQGRRLGIDGPSKSAAMLPPRMEALEDILYGGD